MDMRTLLAAVKTPAQRLSVKFALFLCKLAVCVHDFLTLPIYIFVDKPWNYWNKNIIWARLEDESNPYSAYVRQILPENIQKRLEDESLEAETLDQLFRRSVAIHGSKKCFGTREVFGEEDVLTSAGKHLKKLSLGEYKWLSYDQVSERVDRISRGLLAFGVRPKKPIVLLAETRVEWILTAQACFRINVPLVTVYATLGPEGIAHGINETEVTHVITSEELLPKLTKVFSDIPKVTNLVYMEGLSPPSLGGIPDQVKVASFSEMELLGDQKPVITYEPPAPEDMAILMYTSGSTGVPKGVMITNRNVIMTIRGLNDVLGSSQLGPDDIYIAYLPLAHVMELGAECYLISCGIPVGYSTPQTLTDFSTAVKKGCKGDLKVLKPTLLAAVPLMLDRIRKSILQLAGAERSFSRGMFDFAIAYKTFWLHKGFETPRIDRQLLKTYRDFMGGHLRFVVCGSAPISPDTQDFVRACLSVQPIQGYAATETACSATLMAGDDLSSGRVGAPLTTCKIRLEDWKDGGYFVKNSPHPQGEIVVGGQCVTLGYYKNEKQTEECFTVDDKGTRWFYTGDIGEVYPDGTIKIIDRKKDLVKLQFGEYVALGKVEAELKTCSLVDNICVVGNGLQSHLVALVVPNSQQLKTLAMELGKGDLTLDEMCQDQEIAAKVCAKIKEHGRKCRLFGAEVPAKISLCSEDWVPESGLVTAALKIRRKIIEKHYQEDIEKMYGTAVSQNGKTM